MSLQQQDNSHRQHGQEARNLTWGYMASGYPTSRVKLKAHWPLVFVNMGPCGSENFKTLLLPESETVKTGSHICNMYVGYP